MKYRLYSHLPTEAVPGVCKDQVLGSSVSGKTLVSEADGVHHACYEIQLSSGEETQWAAPNETSNHIYYILTGSGNVKIAETSEVFQLGKDDLLAIPPDTRGTFISSADLTRVLIVHVKKNDSIPRGDPKVVYRKLSDIVGGMYDVAWTNGRSRRFLLESDGFNVSVHNTVCYPNHSTPLWYRKNYETCYYIRGDILYTWNDGQSKAGFRQANPEEGDGLLILLDQNDPHVLHAQEEECECICLFHPPLKGTEIASFSSEKAPPN